MNWRFGVLTVLLGVCLGGCASKRVSSQGVVREPVASPPKTEVPAKSVPVETSQKTTALPEPKPLSRSGNSAVPANKRQATALGPRAVDLAKAQLGKPYQWGAAGPNKFDCSGLVQYVFSNLGVVLPRVSGQQASEGVHVDRVDLLPGDLVFFRIGGTRIDHVGIYVGRGKFIHAPRKHNPVRFDSLNDSWWRRKFKGGRRLG